MPRRNTPVKRNYQNTSTVSLAAVDIHFHGAFGIDLMTAPERKLTELTQLLAQNGVGAFCPTTLSVSLPSLKKTLNRWGQWIRHARADLPRTSTSKALPLGIHLEGPYIHPQACGAHPPHSLRPFRLCELEELWEASRKTLKIVTLAPELLSRDELSSLRSWSQNRKIVLSAGHSRASEEQAQQAFVQGVRSVTHAWNALHFHHRSPGILGAALGNPDLFVELIFDGIHVSPTVIRWTQKIHGARRICAISDCVSSGHTSKGWHTFGPLKARFKNGASRLPSNQLAGGGLLLTESFAKWVQTEARLTGKAPLLVLKNHLPSLGEAPLKLLGLPKSVLRGQKIFWETGASSRKLKYRLVT